MDLTVIAIPGFLGSMGAEYLWLKKTHEERGPSPADYELRDTLVSLGMGQLSLLTPFLTKKLLDQITPGKGRWAKTALGVTAGAAVAVTVADLVQRRLRDELPEAGVLPSTRGDSASNGASPNGAAARALPTVDVGDHPRSAPEAGVDGCRNDRRRRLKKLGRIAKRVQRSAGVTALVGAGVTAAAVHVNRSAAERLFDRRILSDKGTGVLAVLAATIGWDFIYYWNHRLSHESRYLWAMHVVHHSSERYNLSTALRQPVTGTLVLSIPYSLMALFGLRPQVIEAARGINLLYQFWIHTEAIPRLERFERWFNAPSLHRAHHGSNRQYLDRNHGSILSIWDRLFGTYEPEEERVRYGLTENIGTFNPVTVMFHEFRDILREAGDADSWSDRVGIAFRSPGWAYERRAQRTALPAV